MCQMTRLWAAFCLSVAPAICGSGCAATPRNCAAATVIPHMLEAQAEAWNRGDVEAFMQPYWHSPDLTFTSGGEVRRGWRAVLRRYKQRYPTRENMGRLSLSKLEVRELGPRAALVLGRWHIERSEPIGGRFTLVCRKMPGGWVIVHDHTSTDRS